MSFTWKTLNDISDHAGLAMRIEDIQRKTWPEFMIDHDMIIDFIDDMIACFPECQYFLFDGDEVAAVGNCLCLNWEGPCEDLPDEGWSWALRKSAEDHRAGVPPNTLVAVSITINPKYQGRKLSSVALDKMKAFAIERDLSTLIVPARPTLKERYPLTPIANYVQWRNDEGLFFDPWLRLHQRLGGKIVKVCPLSVQLTASISDWETWTRMRFPESGDYVAPGALNPISIDRESGQGHYVEPSVWVVHYPSKVGSSQHGGQ